jgi:adenosylmethionine-8-amino-7-oxononanoate aminotransferase
MDRSSVLHPFTNLKDYASGAAGGPTIMETGKGVRITDATGREYIDGFAGLYCVNVGYGRTEVAEAIARQAYKLAYYHSYAAHTTEELARLSDRLVKMAPGNKSSTACPALTPMRPRLSSFGTITICAASRRKRRSSPASAAIMVAPSCRDQ